MMAMSMFRAVTAVKNVAARKKISMRAALGPSAKLPVSQSPRARRY